jgi:diguanylate cyclase (GGDEF)-like protein
MFKIDVSTIKPSGRTAADRALRAFADAARTSTRADDVVGRTGEDEYCILIQGGPDQAQRVANRVQRAFQAKSRVGTRGLTITVSVTPVVGRISINDLMDTARRSLASAHGGNAGRTEAA